MLMQTSPRDATYHTKREARKRATQARRLRAQEKSIRELGQHSKSKFV